ncbi:MAG: hypothetical protein J3R72DRAFT_462783, partial [Linnemannia gamsii]
TQLLLHHTLSIPHFTSHYSMSSQYSNISVKRPMRNSRLRSSQNSPQLSAKDSTRPIDLSQDSSASDDGSEEEYSEDDPDKTTLLERPPTLSPKEEPSDELTSSSAQEHLMQVQSTQEQLAHDQLAQEQSGQEQSAHEQSAHASSSAREQPPPPTLPDMPSVPEAGLIPLHPDQLAVYAQQQQDLFAQIMRVEERILDPNAVQERSFLYDLHQDLCRREQELRYMVEARQTWDAAVRMYTQRMTDLSYMSRIQHLR